MTKFKGASPNPSRFGAGSSDTVPKPLDPNQLPPIFSFEHMISGNGYSIDCCDKDHRSALAVTLFKLSKVTWLQIKQAPKHGIGSEKIAKSAIKAALPKAVTEDAELLAIRYKGKHPMVGFRIDRTFNILFLDKSFSIYDHG